MTKESGFVPLPFTLASGECGQKLIRFGGTRTSIFEARKSQVSIHLLYLSLTRSTGNAQKSGGGVFLRHLRFTSFADTVCGAFHDDQLLFVHAVQHPIDVFLTLVLSIVSVRAERSKE